jgi:hypothetical protein
MARPLTWVLLGCVWFWVGCQTQQVPEAPLRPAPASRLTDVSIPEGFTADTQNSWLYANEKMRLAHLSYKGPAGVQTTVRFFLDQMPMQNWKRSHVTEDFGYTSLVFTKGVEVCTITLYRSWGTTHVTVNLTRQTP